MQNSPMQSPTGGMSPQNIRSPHPMTPSHLQVSVDLLTYCEIVFKRGGSWTQYLLTLALKLDMQGSPESSVYPVRRQISWIHN